MEYLVESALLTHGLKSVSNETIKKEWQDPGKRSPGLIMGKSGSGISMSFLNLEAGQPLIQEIDCDLLEKALVEKQSGALTASGTMAVCVKMGIPVAITCGMVESGTSKEKNSARIFRLFSRFRWS